MKKRYITQEELMQQDFINKYWMEQNTLVIKDLYPTVISIVVKYKRTSASFEQQEDKDWIYLRKTSNDKFYVFIPCINETCVMGGFDLRKEISRVIQNKQTSLTGKMSCTGWEDAERVDAYHCLSSLVYCIDIEYTSEVSND